MPELNKQALKVAITAIAKSVTHSHHGDAVTAIQAYLDALPEQEDWQPIETAPRDGKLFAAYNNDPHHDCGPHDFYVCFWRDYAPTSTLGERFTLGEGARGEFYYEYASYHNLKSVSAKPTHWRPLPDPPGSKAVLSPLPNTHEEAK